VWPRCPCRKKVVQRQVVVKEGCNPLTTRHSNSFLLDLPPAEHGHRSTVVPVRMVMISIGLYGTRNKKEPANYARYIIDDPGPGVGGNVVIKLTTAQWSFGLIKTENNSLIELVCWGRGDE